MVCSFQLLALHSRRPSVTQTGLNAWILGIPFLLFTLVLLWFQGNQRNKLLFLEVPLKLSIKQWLVSLVSSNGWPTYLKILVFNSVDLLYYTVIIIQHYILQQILRSKYIEINCHIVREKIQSGLLKLVPIAFVDQLVYIYTKALPPDAFQFLNCKLGMSNIHSPWY